MSTAEELRSVAGDDPAGVYVSVCRDLLDQAAAELDRLRADRERLYSIIYTCYGLLPIFDGPAMAFVDANLIPHVMRAADEIAVLREQVKALEHPR